jgi:uncharacterized cupredoxin-like copper-binding protein
VALLANFDQVVAERPAQVQSGSCEAPGEVIAALTPLERPEGEAQGQGSAIEAERSYTSLPIAFDALLDGQTSIDVVLSDDQPDVTIACGDIGGVPDDNGAVVIKLSERNGSGYTGIAFLSPGDGTTGASVFVAGRQTVAETRELVAATPSVELTGLEPVPTEEPTAIPTPTAEPVQIVDVALLEWIIDAPTETRAGQVQFVVTNEGTEAHSLVVDSGGTTVAELDAPLDPGDSTVLTVELGPGDYVLYCPLADGEHREKGMETELTVVP